MRLFLFTLRVGPRKLRRFPRAWLIEPLYSALQWPLNHNCTAFIPAGPLRCLPFVTPSLYSLRRSWRNNNTGLWLTPPPKRIALIAQLSERHWKIFSRFSSFGGCWEIARKFIWICREVEEGIWIQCSLNQNMWINTATWGVCWELTRRSRGRNTWIWRACSMGYLIVNK